MASKKSLAAAAAALLVAPSPVLSLDDTRTQCAIVAKESALKTSEVRKLYAGAMCQHFDLTDNAGKVTTKWFDLAGKLKEGVKAERAKFVKVMADRGFESATIDTYWDRVKDDSGRVKKSSSKDSKSADALNIRDIKTIIGRIDNTEAKNIPFSRKALLQILQAADLMGVELKGYAVAQGVDLYPDADADADADAEA